MSEYDDYDNGDSDTIKYYIDQNDRVVKADKGIVKLFLAPEIREIGAEVFKDQNDLETVIMNGKCVKIGEGAFKNCPQLKKVELSGALLEIPREAFADCKSLSYVLIPDSCFAIKSKAFKNCNNLKYIKIPSTVGELAPDAFSSCRNLRVVEGPEKFRSFFNRMGVYYITSKTSFIKQDEEKGLNIFLPEHILEIKDGMFENDERMTSFSAGQNLERIGDRAFKNAKDLLDVYLGDCSLTELGNEAFNDCPNLIIVVLPKSLKEIKPLTFANSSKLEDVLLPEDLEKVGQFAFAYTNVGEIDFPESFHSLAESAFEGCAGLDSVNLSDKVRTIPKYCFEGCRNLSRINLENVYAIDDFAFKNCYGLNFLKTNAHRIGARAFANCFGLESAFITTGSMKEGVFSGCKNLMKVVLNGNIKIIPCKAFESCFKLKNITIPESVQKISDKAFINCKNLGAFEAKGVEEIGDYAFWNCEKLVYVNLSDNLKKISDTAFESCPNIRFVTAPERFRNYFESRGIYFTSTQEYTNNIKKIDNTNGKEG